MKFAFFGYIALGILIGTSLHFGFNIAAELALLSGTLAALVFGQAHLFLTRNPQEIEDIELLLYETRKSVKVIDQKLDVVEARSTILEDTLKSELDQRLDRLVEERKALDSAAMDAAYQRTGGHRDGVSRQLPPVNSAVTTDMIGAIPVNSELPAPPPFSAADMAHHTAQTTHPLRSRTGADDEALHPFGDIGPEPNTNDSPLNNTVRNTILNGRVNLHLQKIVSLPLRQVQFYECFSRPQEHDDTIILPQAFLQTARNGGMGPALDAQTLYRTMAIQRKLASSERRVGLFCNMTAASLLENQSLKGILAQIGNDTDIARALIFEFTYLEYQQHAQILQAKMQKLTDIGVRFSLDNVPALNVDCDALVQYGVRFLKMHVKTFVQASEDTESRPICFGERISCDANGLSDAFARQGISLIVDHVETEDQIRQLEELHIGYAQGFAFSPPKALKPEISKATQPDASFMRNLAHL